MMGKSTWFKGGGGKHSSLGTRNSGGGRIGGGKKSKLDLKTRTVLFVEHMPGGILAKRLREKLTNMEEVMGFRIKVVERTGTQLKDLFSLTNVWGGSLCSREDCTTCQQDCEEKPDCTRRSVVYESIC